MHRSLQSVEISKSYASKGTWHPRIRGSPTLFVISLRILTRFSLLLFLSDGLHNKHSIYAFNLTNRTYIDGFILVQRLIMMTRTLHTRQKLHSPPGISSNVAIINSIIRINSRTCEKNLCLLNSVVCLMRTTGCRVASSSNFQHFLSNKQPASWLWLDCIFKCVRLMEWCLEIRKETLFAQFG